MLEAYLNNEYTPLNDCNDDDNDKDNNNDKNVNQLLKKNYDTIHKIISNKFLGKLYNNQYKNWFDIENSYFQELIKIKNKYVSYNNVETIKDELKENDSNNNVETIKDELKELNKNLLCIKENLIEYLKTIKIHSNNNISQFFNSISANNSDYNIFIINFNYTKTIELYFTEFSDGFTNIKNVKINYIHGNLEKNNIIFGYGNDKHKEYRNIKMLEENEFLINFKTFAYLDNNNYSKIYDEIIDNNSVNDYIVFVLGHSLGTTDKTLLEEILNNEKCKKIHLFKRKDLENDKLKLEKSFKELQFSASRILENEESLRKKLLPQEESIFFP